MLKGQGYKTRLLNIEDEVWDRRLGIKTFGYYPGSGGQGEKDWRLHYKPTPYSRIFKMLKLVKLDETDIFVDLGAGLGRSVFAADFRGAKKSIGVDIVEELCVGAEKNRDKNANRNVEFVCANAADYKFPSGISILFMAHSFGEDTLEKVVENLEPHGQGLRIIYINPICDNVLEQSGWLECTHRIPVQHTLLPKIDRYAATIWKCSIAQ